LDIFANFQQQIKKKNKGMEFLLENSLIENTPDAIAQFLFSGEGLNKTSIGNYLGEKWVI
jgi:Sec7-like guanine-nucleotide exchange factor